ncbi:unnamed protein product [Arctogadus glacialis]
MGTHCISTKAGAVAVWAGPGRGGGVVLVGGLGAGRRHTELRSALSRARLRELEHKELTLILLILVGEGREWGGGSLTSQKGLLHLSPDVYQEMEASRLQGGGGPGAGGGLYLASKEPAGPYYGHQGAAPAGPTAALARELLLNGQTAGDAPLGPKGKSPPSSSSSSSSSGPASSSSSSSSSLVSVQPAQQLDYLARIQGFQQYQLNGGDVEL